MAGVILSFVLAIVLRVMPLPPAWFMVNPDWVALLLIYWTLIAPRSVNLIFAWFVGLAVDGLTGRLLGQYALAYVSMTYLNIRFRHTILSLPLSLQCLWVLFLLLISQLLILWTQRVELAESMRFTYWLPAFTGTLFWPLVYWGLRLVGRFHPQA